MRAVLFDFDGVLVNSEPLHYSALRDALLPEGVAIDQESYVSSFLAFDDRGAIRRALEHHGRAFDRERVERVALRKAQLFEEKMHEIPFFPGARALVRALEQEVPIAIASGARSAEIETLLSAGGLRDAFTAVVGADQVGHGKPHPEPYLTAMARVAVAAKAEDLRPEECLVIEDSMPGIAAGLAAGMRVVAVTNSYPAAKLSAAQRVVASLEELTVASLRALFD